MTNSTQERCEEFDNKLLALIQRHFPNIPVAGKENDESWSRWLAFARDCATLRRAPETVEMQPWPNHNWCVGCTGENCPQPVERTKHQPVTTGVEPTSAGMSDEEIMQVLRPFQTNTRYMDERSCIRFARAILASAKGPDTALSSEGGQDMWLDCQWHTKYEPCCAECNYSLQQSKKAKPVSAAPESKVQMPEPVLVGRGQLFDVYAHTQAQMQSYGEACAAEASAQVERMREALEKISSHDLGAIGAIAKAALSATGQE